MSWYKTQLNDWLKTIDVKARTVFDIGGRQGPVEGRTKSWEVKNYRVLDLPDFDIELNGYHFPVPPHADVIFCLEVFEYLIDPLTALKNICRMLEDGGTAYITFAFAYPHHEELEMDSLRYTEFGIRRLAEAAGLDVQEIIYRVDRSGFLQNFYVADKMHPSKNYSHHDATGFIVRFSK